MHSRMWALLCESKWNWCVWDACSTATDADRKIPNRKKTNKHRTVDAAASIKSNAYAWLAYDNGSQGAHTHTRLGFPSVSMTTKSCGLSCERNKCRDANSGACVRWNYSTEKSELWAVSADNINSSLGPHSRCGYVVVQTEQPALVLTFIGFCRRKVMREHDRWRSQCNRNSIKFVHLD